jgi:hypothetical protein
MVEVLPAVSVVTAEKRAAHAPRDAVVVTELALVNQLATRTRRQGQLPDLETGEKLSDRRSLTEAPHVVKRSLVAIWAH